MCLYVIYYAIARKFTYELLSLQAKIIRAAPSPLSLHCKDRKFSPDFDSIPNSDGTLIILALELESSFINNSTHGILRLQ